MLRPLRSLDHDQLPGRIFLRRSRLTPRGKRSPGEIGTAIPRISSVRELFACAVALERHAAQRYRMMAARMAQRARPDLAELFAGLAREEERHEAWVRAQAGDDETSATAGGWPSALGEAPEPPNPDEIARASPYACLAEAVRSEQKAFSFFSYIAAEAEDPEVMAIAEDLARQELSHLAILRQARRRAWRHERRTPGPWPKPSEIASLDGLLRAAATGEADLARVLAAAGSRSAEFEELLGETTARLGGLGVELEPAALEALSGTDREVVEAVLRRAEAAFDFYDAVASAAPDEAVMLRAQDLTAFALDRLKRLHQSSSSGH